MSTTSDPNDPRLGHGVDAEPGPQNPVYLVLSEEERAKGFVRPLRRSYIHVGGGGPKGPLRDLTPEEHERYDQYGYVKFEPSTEIDSSVLGTFWTQERLNAVGGGCQSETTMGLALCETYARDPHFYGSTYCCACMKHLPVSEFRWVEDGEVVGS